MPNKKNDHSKYAHQMAFVGLIEDSEIEAFAEASAEREYAETLAREQFMCSDPSYRRLLQEVGC